MPAHVGVQRLLRRAEGVEQVQGQLPVVALVVPLQQDEQRMVTRRASSTMLRGTKLPANRRAATMRGSTTASRRPMAITPPAYPTGPPISGSRRRASRAACHSGTASRPAGGRAGRRSRRPARRPPARGAGRRGHRRIRRTGAGHRCRGARWRPRRSPPPRRVAPGPAVGVHRVQSAGVAEQDQRGRCGSRRPQDTGNLAEGEAAFEDAVVEALFRSESQGRAFRECSRTASRTTLSGAQASHTSRSGWAARRSPLAGASA